MSTASAYLAAIAVIVLLVLVLAPVAATIAPNCCESPVPLSINARCGRGDLVLPLR